MDEHECDNTITTMSQFGFLSLQAAVSKQKTSERYAFLHKSFQEFFLDTILLTKFLTEILTMTQ